jgi:hypothetical protein
VSGCCEYGDEPSVSGATELVTGVEATFSGVKFLLIVTKGLLFVATHSGAAY